MPHGRSEYWKESNSVWALPSHNGVRGVARTGGLVLELPRRERGSVCLLTAPGHRQNELSLSAQPSIQDNEPLLNLFYEIRTYRNVKRTRALRIARVLRKGLPQQPLFMGNAPKESRKKNHGRQAGRDVTSQ